MMRVESLESRTLLSVIIVVCTGDSETVNNLVITSDAEADVIEVRPHDGVNVTVTANGVSSSYTGISVVAVYGGDGNDTITLRGSDIDYFVDGGLGDDVIFGSAGDDWLQDEDGDDFIVGGGGADYLVGGLGDDTIKGGAGDDVLLGEAGVDQLFGGSGVDRSVADTLDVIIGIEEVL